MFTVFKAYGRLSGDVYYGYTQLQDLREGFLHGAKRSLENRKDNMLVQLNGNNPDNIMVEELYQFEDELQAWECRNNLRANSSDSISGPTFFPCSLFNRIKQTQPEKVVKWKIATDCKNTKTARDAWALGLWSKKAVTDLVEKHNKKDVVRDLDTLTPFKFAEKYELCF